MRMPLDWTPSAWLASCPSDDDALRQLEKARVPCAPVLSIPEAVNHPHLRERRRPSDGS